MEQTNNFLEKKEATTKNGKNHILDFIATIRSRVKIKINSVSGQFVMNEPKSKKEIILEPPEVNTK